MSESETASTPRRIAQLAAMALLAAASAACARLEIQGQDGSVEVERHFGVLAITLAPAAAAQVVSTTGFGVISTGRSVVIGYHNVELALLGRDCRLILWVEKAEHLTAAYELLGERDDLCVIPAHSE